MTEQDTIFVGGVLFGCLAFIIQVPTSLLNTHFK